MWGPDAWRVLEDLCSVATSPQQYVAQAALIKAIVLLCPCPLCRPSARTFIQLIPLQAIATGQQPALAWVWRLHNWVNLKLGNPLLQYCKLQKRLRLRKLHSAGASVHILRFLGTLGANSYTFGHSAMLPMLDSMQVLWGGSQPLLPAKLLQLRGAVKNKDRQRYYRSLASIHNNINVLSAASLDADSLAQLHVDSGLNDIDYTSGRSLST